MRRTLFVGAMWLLAGVAGVCVFLAPRAAFAQRGGPEVPELKIGDPAPALGGNVKWLRGERHDKWEPGTVYVVDFWATWCGPCVEAMPHLEQIHKHYAEQQVKVVGVAIWARPGAASPQLFLSQGRGAAFTYSFAEDFGQSMETKFMAALRQNTIPTVVIIDRQGRLAWVGNPLSDADDMSEALELIVQGKYDPVRAAALKEAADKKLAAANELARNGDWDASMALVEEVIQSDRVLFGKYAVLKYTVLHAKLRRYEEAAAYGRRLVKEDLRDQPGRLNELAWFIADPDPNREFPQPDFELAVMAAERAAELTLLKDAPILDTLAAAQAGKGDYAAAAKSQRRALELTVDPALQREYAGRLREYEGRGGR